MHVFCTNNRGIENYLTLEKKYEVIDPHGFDEEFDQYTIINDKGIENGYARSRFAQAGSQKWRDLQLKKII